MSLLPFVVATFVGTGAALALRRFAGLAAAVGLAGLVASLVLAAAIRPGERFAIGGTTLATTEFLRLFLVLGCAVGTLLALVGVASGARREVPAVTLGTLGAAGLALALPDARIAVLAAAGGGLLGAVVTLVPGASRGGATVGIRELRAVVVAASLAVAAAGWLARPLADAAIDPAVLGLVYLGFALAVVVRFGLIPFHARAARLADAAPEIVLPALLAWGPATLALVVFASVDGSVAVLEPDLGPERLLLAVVALVTVVLAAFAAWIQDELAHVVAYSIVGDAGIVLFGLAALDPEAWAPTRAWIVAFVVARSAFAAWAAATRLQFETGRIDDLRGWGLRSPLLGVGLALVAVASLGLPGLAAWDARAGVLATVAAGPLHGLLLLATLLPLAWYGRLAAVGIARPLAGVPGEPWAPAWRPVDLTALGTWLGGMFQANRVALAIALSLVLALVAIATSAGAFGLLDAAAELAPPVDAGPA